MSDTKYSTVAVKFRKIDKVDEDWMKDKLSDDEIELPKGLPVPSALEDDDAGEDKSRAAEDWTDLSLETFLKE